MKPIFTNLKGILLFSVFSIITVNTQAQTGTTSNFNVSFNSIPTLISGTSLSVNAKYRFAAVAPNVYADVTIVSATGGATISLLDDNTITKPESFSPSITVPANSNGLVEFRFEFFNNNGTVRTLDSLAATAIDIDGTSTVHEVDVLNLGAGATLSYLSSTLEISVVQNGNFFTGTNIGGITYPGIDTSAKQVMFSVKNKNISSFIYKAGENNAGNTEVTRLKSIYFKGFNYPAAGSLPVKYLSFNGNAIDKAILLNWVTSTEINNSYFEIERSFTGNEFSLIGMILDGFENGTTKEYAFKDNSPSLENKDIVYYRLKQFDLNGKFSYSNILVVRIKSLSKIDIQVSPNPFTERLTLRFTSNEKNIADVRIVNISGQTVINKKVSVNKGYNNLQIEGLDNLKVGTYVATVVVNGEVVGSEKIVK